MEGHKIHSNSDIDIATLGLKDEDYFPALRKLDEIVPKNIHVDLITIETASKSMKKLISESGVLL